MKKEITKKIMSLTTLLTLPSLAVLGVSFIGSDDNYDSKDSSNFLNFKNANRYFDEVTGSQGNTYGYGTYQNFGNLTSKYGTNKFNKLPYSDVRTWQGTTSPLDGSIFDSELNGQRNLLEKGLKSMGITLATQAKNRLDINTSSPLLNPSQQEFKTMAYAILDQLDNFVKEVNTNPNLKEKLQNAKFEDNDGYYFLKELYFEIKDKVSKIKTRRLLSGRGIDFLEYGMTPEGAVVPTIKKFDFEQNTLGWIQALIFSLKSYSFGLIQSIDGSYYDPVTKQKQWADYNNFINHFTKAFLSGWNSFGNVAKKLLWDANPFGGLFFNMAKSKLTEKIQKEIINSPSKDKASQMILFNDIYCSNKFGKFGHKELDGVYSIISNKINSAKNNHIDFLKLLIPSTNPLVVDYNGDFKQEVLMLLKDFILSKEGANNFNVEEAEVVAKTLIDYIKRQADIANIDPAVLFESNANIFGDVIKNAWNDKTKNGFNISGLKDALKSLKLVAPSTNINNKQSLLDNISKSKEVLSKNYDNDLANGSNWQQANLRYDYYNSIDNKISTAKEYFDFISDIDININNLQEWQEYQDLKSSIKNLNKDETLRFQQLSAKFSNKTETISIKEYLARIASIHNLDASPISKLSDESDFKSIFVTIQKLYGLKDNEIYNSLPSDLVAFEGSLYNLIKELESQRKDLTLKMYNQYEDTGLVSDAIKDQEQAINKQIANVNNLLSANEVFKNLLNSLNLEKFDIKDKIKEYNVNKANIENNLSTLMLDSLNGMNMAINYINDKVLKDMVKKLPSEETQLDKVNLAERYYGSFWKMTGKTLLNIISFQWGDIYSDAKKEHEKNISEDQIVRAKGMTLSSLLKVQAMMKLASVVSKTSYIANMANKVLYMQSLVNNNDFDALRENDDFKELFNLFVLSKNADHLNDKLIDSDSPDYLIAQVVSSLIKSLRNLIAFDNLRNPLVQGNINESNDLKFLGQYVSQAIFLNYNYQRALGSGKDDIINKQLKDNEASNKNSTDLINFLEEFNNDFYTKSTDLENTIKFNILNQGQIRDDINDYSDLSEKFVNQIDDLYKVWNGILNDKTTVQNSEFYKKLINASDNLDYFSNITYSQLQNLVDETFFKLKNPEYLLQLTVNIKNYLDNIKIIRDLKQAKNNKGQKDLALESYNQINNYLCNNWEVSTDFCLAYSNYYKNHIEKALASASLNINAVDGIISSFDSATNAWINKYYNDEDYMLSLMDINAVSYINSNPFDNFNFDSNSDYNVYDEDIERYSNNITNNLIADMADKMPTTKLTWKQKLSNGYYKAENWWADNMPKHLFTRAWGIYKLGAVPVYSRYFSKGKHWLYTYQQQLMLKNAKKLTKLSKTLGGSLSSVNEALGFLKAGKAKEALDLIRSGKNTTKTRKWWNIIGKGIDKFKYNVSLAKSEKTTLLAIKNYGKLQNWTKATTLPALKTINNSQLLTFLSKDLNSKTFSGIASDVFKQFGTGNRLNLYTMVAKDQRVAKELVEKFLVNSKNIQWRAKQLAKFNKLVKSGKNVKATKFLTKLSKSRKLLTALNSRKVLAVRRLAKLGAFFKGIGRGLMGAIKTNPVGLVISIALDSVINFLTFDTSIKAGYWLPLNAKELDNLVSEEDYNNNSESIEKNFNDGHLLNPVKVKNTQTSINYLAKIVSDEDFALSEAMRLLNVNDKAKFYQKGTVEYNFLYYFKNNAYNQFMSLSNADDNISSNHFKNTTLYYDNLEKQLNSVDTDSPSETKNFANYINRTNIIDLNINYEQFLKNPFTKYLDFNAFNAINNEFFVANKDGNSYGAFNSTVRLNISDLLNGGLSSLCYIGNNATTSFVNDKTKLNELLQNPAIADNFNQNINASATSYDINSAEMARNKTARWYSLIPLFGNLIANSQRDGKLAFKLDAQPTIKSMPYIPSETAYEILQSLNGNGSNRQSLFGYSMITVKLVQMANGHLGLKVIQTIYDNSSASYSYNNKQLNYKFINSFNSAVLNDEKHLNSDFFKSVINNIENAINSNSNNAINNNNYSKIFMDIENDLTKHSNLDGMSLIDIANRHLMLSHYNPLISDNYFIKAYALRLKKHLLEALTNASMPHSLISNSIINQQLNDINKQLIKDIDITRLDISPAFDSKGNLKLKIRFDVKFKNAFFNGVFEPEISFVLNNRIYSNLYSLKNNNAFLNSKNDFAKLKSIEVEENNNSKLKAILKQTLKIKEYSSLNQRDYDLEAIYQESLDIDDKELADLEHQYISLLKNQYDLKISDIKFQILASAFEGTWLQKQEFAKEYVMAKNKQEVLDKYYNLLNTDDKLILEKQINSQLFNLITPQEEFNKSLLPYTDKEERMKFLAFKLNKIYYNKKTFENYDEIAKYFNQDNVDFNINLKNPFSFKVYTNKQINLNNGGSITFKNNFSGQSFSQVNVKDSEVVFAYDLNKKDTGERIFYNEYSNKNIKTPYQLTFDLVDKNNKKTRFNINFNLPSLSSSDINFKQHLDSNISRIYSDKYINIRMLPFSKSLDTLTLDDINSLLKEGELNDTFGNDPDALALNYINKDPLLSPEQKASAKSLFLSKQKLGDNSRFSGFIVKNPFQTFKDKASQESNMISGSYSLNSNSQINELFYDGAYIEYINDHLPFTTVDIAYMFDKNKLLDINGLVEGSQITWFKTKDGNKADGKIQTIITSNDKKTIINFGSNESDYEGLYKLSFLIPHKVGNKVQYIKFNKLVFISKNKANEVNDIKQEINNYFLKNNTSNYLLDLNDNSYYQSLAPFINKLNRSGKPINGHIFNQLYKDYIFSKNKYLINSIKYKNIANNVSSLLELLKNTIADKTIKIPKDLVEYQSMLGSNLENNLTKINQYKKQEQLLNSQLINLLNLLKNNQNKLNTNIEYLNKLKALKNKDILTMTYSQFIEIIYVSKQEFRKMQVKQWLYQSQQTNTLYLNADYITKLRNYIYLYTNDLDKNLPKPTDPDTYSVSDLADAINELNVHNNIINSQKQANDLSSYASDLINKLSEFKNSYESLLSSYINNLDITKHNTNLLDNLELKDKDHLSQAMTDINNKILYYIVWDNNKYQKISIKKYLENRDKYLDVYACYEYVIKTQTPDGKETIIKKQAYANVAKVDKKHLMKFVNFDYKDNKFVLDFKPQISNDSIIKLINIDCPSSLDEEVKNQFGQYMLINNIIMSFINNTMSLSDITKIDDYIKSLEIIKNKQWNKTTPELMAYFADLLKPDTYDKVKNNTKLLLNNAYSILRSSFIYDFKHLVDDKINAVNDIIDDLENNNFGQQIQNLRQNIDNVNNSINNLTKLQNLALKKWFENVIFSQDNINIINYLKEINNIVFKTNLEYLDFLNKFLNNSSNYSNNTINLKYLNILKTLYKIEKEITKLFNIDDGILLNKTSDISALEYVSSKLNNIISTPDNIAKLLDMLRVKKLVDDKLLSNNPNWSVQGIINDIHIEDGNCYFVLQLIARSKENLTKQIVMLKIPYDKDIEYYTINQNIDEYINNGVWQKVIKWNPALANKYANIIDNPEYILRDKKLNNKFIIKDKNKIQNDKIIKNDVLKTLDSFNNILSLREFNNLFSTLLINSLGDYTFLWDVKFKISQRNIAETADYLIREYTLVNNQYTIKVNAVLLKGKQNQVINKQVMSITNNIDNKTTKSYDINALSYEFNKDVDFVKDINNIVNITKANKGLDLIKDIINGSRNSVTLNATEFQQFLLANNMTFANDMDSNSFFKDIDLVDSSGNFKPYIYQIHLANNNKNIDIVKSDGLGLLMINLKISIYKEYKTKYTSKTFSILIKQQENDYDNYITNNLDNVIVNNNDTRSSLSEIINDINNKVNEDYLLYSLEYLSNNNYFADSKMLNLKSALFFGLTSFKYINSNLNDINSSSGSLNDKVDYLYEYIINHYDINFNSTNNMDVVRQIIKFLVDNYIFANNPVSDKLDKDGKIIFKAPTMNINNVYKLSHFGYSKTNNYRDIKFRLRFTDLKDDIKASLIKKDKQGNIKKLYDSNGSEVENIFNRYFLEYNGMQKYVSFRVEEGQNAEAVVKMITSQSNIGFDLEDLLLDKEKNLDRDVTNNLISQRLVKVNELIQNLIELQKQTLIYKDNKITKANELKEFNLEIYSTYNKDLSKSILPKNNYFTAKQLLFDKPDVDYNKLISDKQYILSTFSQINPNSYLSNLNSDDYNIRLLKVIKQDVDDEDIISYVYEIVFKNQKIQNFKLQLNFKETEGHLNNVDKGTVFGNITVSDVIKYNYSNDLTTKTLLKANFKFNNAKSYTNIISDFYNLEAKQAKMLNKDIKSKNQAVPWIIAFAGILTAGIAIGIYVIIKRRKSKIDYKG